MKQLTVSSHQHIAVPESYMVAKVMQWDPLHIECTTYPKFGDKTSMKLARNPIQHDHTEHIDIRNHFILFHFIEFNVPPALNAKGYGSRV